MYPGKHAAAHPDRPAVIMAGSGETITYGELEARSNRLAHFLRARGVGRLDHYSIYMENNARYVECCAAGERSGHYYTCVNSFLTVEELAYILNNSQSKVLITSQAKRDIALAGGERDEALAGVGADDLQRVAGGGLDGALEGIDDAVDRGRGAVDTDLRRGERGGGGEQGEEREDLFHDDWSEVGSSWEMRGAAQNFRIVFTCRRPMPLSEPAGLGLIRRVAK